MITFSIYLKIINTFDSETSKKNIRIKAYSEALGPK